MPYGLLTAHIHYLRCHRRKFQPNNLVLHVPFLMRFLKTLPSVFLVPDIFFILPRYLFCVTFPQVCHDTYFFRDRGCSLPITRNLQLHPFPSMGTWIALPFLHVNSLTEGCVPLSCSPAQSLLWLQNVQSEVHWADWVKAARPACLPLLPACHCHQRPLLPSYVQRTLGAELGACTEHGQ